MGRTKQAARQAGKAARTLHETDQALSDVVGAGHELPVVKAVGAVSELADQPPLIALCLATIAGGLLLQRPDVVRTGGRMLAAHALATGMKTVVKRSVDRTRPKVTQKGGEYKLESGSSHEHDLNSFPSGHTAGAVAVAAAVARDVPGAGLVAYGTASAFAAAQVPRAAHYASDVIAGAVIGWVAERAASAVIDGAEAAVRARLGYPARV